MVEQRLTRSTPDGSLGRRADAENPLKQGDFGEITPSASATERSFACQKTQISLGNLAADSTCASSSDAAQCTRLPANCQQAPVQEHSRISKRNHEDGRDERREVSPSNCVDPGSQHSGFGGQLGPLSEEHLDALTLTKTTHSEALAEAIRVADGRYAALEKLRDERDRWNSLYHEAVLGAAGAQSLLSRNVAKAMSFAKNALIELNKERQKGGLPPITFLDLPKEEAEWMALCERFLRRHIALFEMTRAKFGLPPIEPPPSFRPFQCNGSGPDGQPCRGEVVLCLKHHDELRNLEHNAAGVASPENEQK